MRPTHKVGMLVAFVVLAEGALAQQKEWSPEHKTFPDDLRKHASNFDRGIAFMDAGKMQVNGVENYGMIGYRGFPYCKHGFWGEVRWIIPFLAVPPQPWATDIVTEDGRHFDRSSFYNCIESISMYFGTGGQGLTYTDWEAQDYSKTRLMGDDTWSNIPLIATSTRPNSWPQGYYDKDPRSPTFMQFIETPGERHWPGHWAIDPDPTSPTYGQEVPGRFVSDKDIYFVMDDKWNGIRKGDEVNVGYPIGFDMEVSGYCYATRAYEDIVFFNYNLIYRDNITDPSRLHYNGPIDGLYFGFIIDPDLPGRDPQGYTMDPWAEDDYCIADTTRGIFLMFDKDGWDRDADDINSEGPVSAYAIAFLKTPRDIGLTGFHFYEQETFDAEPCGRKMEEIIYAMASGKKEILTPQDQQKYFHGPDPNFDDLGLLREWQESYPVGSRPDPHFLMSSGPFSIAPGDTLPLHFCIVGGFDNPGPLDADGFPTNPYEVRFADVLNNFAKAMELYNNKFQGTGPPKTPTLYAVGSKVLDENGLPLVYTPDNKVTLYWDDAAEKSVDILTKERDFEGYRIYKAYFDRDLDYVDWGQEVYEITDKGTPGAILTYVPVFQCDLVNEYEGVDPFQPWFYVGNNSGVVHTWTDNNVVPGIRYRYCITAYDHWYEDREFNCNETARGNSSRDINVIDVIPGVRPVGYVGAQVDTVFLRLAGVGTGPISLKVIDDDAVLGHTYSLSIVDTLGRLAYSVYDEDDRVFKVTDCTNIANETSGVEPEAAPIFDGVGLKIVNHDVVDLLQAGWANVVGDTSNWKFRLVGATKRQPSDYEIRFLGPNADTNAVGTKTVPFQIWNVSMDPPKQVDIFITPTTGNFASGDQIKLWERLTPGSTTRTFTWVFEWTWKPDTQLVGGQEVINPMGKEPAPESVFRVTTKKPFASDRFRFRTYSPTARAITDEDLAHIRVVPNPYVVYSKTELYTGSAQWEQREVRFTHLPPQCTINIYTLTGDHVREIVHTMPSYGEARWDLLTKENLEVSYGIYIWVVKTPNGKTKIGKLAVVK